MKNIYKNTARLTTSVIFFLFISVSVFAQNGVKISNAAGTADPSAMLDIVSANKGVLFPRMSLTSLTANSSPVTNPQAGLVIYNTGSVAVPATGLYFWNGSSWVFLNTGGFSAAGTLNYVARFTASNALGTGVLYDNGTNVGIGTASPGGKLEINNTANQPALSIGDNGVDAGVSYGMVNLTRPADLVRAHLAFIRSGSYVWQMGYVNGTNTLGIFPWTLTTTNVPAMSFTGNSVAVNSLSGTGYRPVYASANGTLATTFPTVTVFSYTGADQTYTVPAGVTSITVKMWGGGGGGGYFGGWTCGFSGGGGGFTQGTLSVSAGQVYTIMVGGGGTGGNIANTANSYGGGSRSCNTGSDCRYGGQGGGRSCIRLSGTELMTAGGGGGGGASRNASLASYGGAGGGMVGQDGNNDQINYGGGKGGFPTAGGAGCTACTGNGTAGAQFAGGNPGSNAYGGGGGGGWYGGGGGGYTESNTMAGGGGGSGYIGGAGVSNAFTVTGNYIQPPQMWDVNYATGVGVGGLTITTSTPLTGGNGRVVIIQN